MTLRALLFVTALATALPAMAGDRIPILDEGAIAHQWTLVPESRLVPPYPPAYAGDPEEVCLVVGYLVNADGHTSDFALLKSWTSGDNSRARTEFWKEFGDLSSRALAQWKYVPAAPGVGRPVYTAATFVFGTASRIASTRKQCTISDLGERLVELRYEPRASRLMAGGVFPDLDVDPYIEERRRQLMMAQREIDEQIRRINETREQREWQLSEHWSDTRENKRQ